MYKLRYIFAFFLFWSLLCDQTYGQKAFNPPLFKELSVIQGTGNVRLVWELDAAAIAASAVVYIYRDSVGEFLNSYFPIDSVKNTAINVYNDDNSNADIKSRQYKLRISEDGLDSKKIPTNFLDFTYDSCKAEVNLSWTNTVSDFCCQPDVNFIRFDIYVSENDGISYVNVGNTTNKNYTISNIQESTHYIFYIAAIAEHAPGSKSTSNTVRLYAQMPISPSYINAQKVSVKEKNSIELEFEIDPTSELTKYKLLRSENMNGPFDTIQTINTSDHIISITDTDVKTSKKVYYYKLVSVNNCGVLTRESEIINSVLLNVTNTDYENTLEWNAFGENTSEDCIYKVYRILEGQEPQLIHTENDFTYTDNIEVLIATNSGSKICYYIECMIIGNPNRSNSNIDCITIEPKVITPTGITPNAIDKNCCFKPVFTFLPKDYFLIIYNRWGNVVFETTNPEASWDGRYPNGQYVPAGAYIYYLKINTENNQSIEKRGNITVIYP